MQTDGETTFLLTGDVMTGRGIDQMLPYPCDPRLFEGYVKSALGYVALAEQANGSIPRPAAFDYVWGEALAELERRRIDARLINLETAVTVSDDPEPKGINYRMNPRNAPVITAAGIDCCVLANNHVLDWGEPGLRETLDTLNELGVRTAGAGLDLEQSRRPAVLPVPGGRVLVFAYGSPTSGVPSTWAAREDRPGVSYLADLGAGAVRKIAAHVDRYRQIGDVVVMSIHWGGNWGYGVPEQQREFAHRVIDRAGVDVVWGHSSHHPRPIEVYKGRLILFGCGDFLNDYEGIRGREGYRSDLVLMYLPAVSLSDGAVRRLEMVPFRIRKFRLERASGAEARWLSDVLSREGRRFGTQVEVDAAGGLVLEHDEASCHVR